MSNSNINSVIAVLQVNNQETAMEWYKNLLGRDADIVPMEGVAEWQIADNAWIQVTVDPTNLDRIGKATVIVGVNNIEEQCSICDKANIKRSEVIEYPEIIKMFKVVDPDGNKISFIEDISNQG
jgi:hypothetical protein